MKKSLFAVLLAVLFGGLAGINLEAQQNSQSEYHLVVIDRTNCPGAVVRITEPLSVLSHGRTGYAIVFGRGTVTIPSGAVVLVDIASNRLSVISEYLSTPSFRRFVSSRDVLDGLGFVVEAERRAGRVPGLPVSTAALPAGGMTEIGYRTVKVRETINIADTAEGRVITRWTSSTPAAVSVNAQGDITGVAIGNAMVKINEAEYIAVAVVPAEDFYVVSESQISLLPRISAGGNESAGNLEEYRTEPTFRLAYRFSNRGEDNGASGINGGLDILGRGKRYEWFWTTYGQGGWFYDLNGIQHEMVNGYQRDERNGVELTLQPGFVYDQGVPYLQITHILHNRNNFAVTGQRFGASADVMMNENDSAALRITPYGAYMADSEAGAEFELMFVGVSGEGITPVDTLWLGEWNEGEHLRYIYEDSRADVSGVDSAIGFSYQNIDLAANETKEFVIRFTLARNGAGRPADVPAEDAPAEDVPAEDVPAEDAPAEDVPAADVPAEDVPAAEAPDPEPANEESGFTVGDK